MIKNSGINNKLNGADYLLLLLYLDNQKPIKGAIRLMKMMFLFEKEIADLLKNEGLDSGILPNFIAYDFGAFSKDVYDQIELFQSIDFIKVEYVYTSEDLAEVDYIEDKPLVDEFYLCDNQVRQIAGRYYEYKIVKHGIDFIEQKIIGEKLIATNQLNILEQFKKRINSLSPRQILRYTYTKYPEYTENSLIKSEVLGDEQ
jgi:hypothetical protein